MSQSISVVLPNYNHAQFLPRAMTCFLRQSLPPDEIIIVDDCSTDDSRPLIATYAAENPSVRVLLNEKNVGAVLSLNRGIEAATGDLLLLASSDDLYRPSLLADAHAALQQCPQAALYCGQGAYFNDEGGSSIQSYDFMHKAGYASPEDLLEFGKKNFMPPINSSATVWRRDLFLKAGGFRPEFKWACDFLMWQMLAFRYGIWFDPTVQADVRWVETSYSNSLKDDIQPQMELLHFIAKALQEPEFDDVRPYFEQTGSLATDPRVMYRFAKSDPVGKPYYSRQLFRHRLRRTFDESTSSIAGPFWGFISLVYNNTPKPILRMMRRALDAVNLKHVKKETAKTSPHTVQAYQAAGHEFWEDLKRTDASKKR